MTIFLTICVILRFIIIMLKRKLQLSIFLFGFVFPGISIPAADILTWEKCVAEMIKNNPDLASAAAEVLKAKYEYRKSYAGFFPRVDAQAGYAKNNSAAAQMGDRSEKYFLGLNASQGIFSGWRDKAGVEKSSLELKISQFALQEVKAALSDDLRSAFIGVTFAQEMSVLAKSIIDRRNSNFRLVELRFEGGREHKGSVLFSKAALKQAEFELAQIQRELVSAKEFLAAILGRKNGMDDELSGEIPGINSDPHGDLHELVILTPQYRQAELQFAASKAALQIAESNFYPDVGIFAGYSRYDQQFFPGQNEWSYGINFTYPLFAGGQDYYARKAAQVNVEQSRANMRSRYLAVRSDLARARSSWENVHSNIAVLEEFLAAADLRAKIARAQYTNGILSFENWDLIENDLIGRQKNLLIGKRDAAISWSGYLRVQGIGVLP